MHFIVTTPVFNGARFIDETILSIASQAGAFSVTYHIQDGGSTDGTLEKLQHWKMLLETHLPILCERFTFSYASEPDTGLYDAVNKGFAACGEGDVMTWINADDRIEVGAFASVAQILALFPSVSWLCGRGAIVDETGSMMLALRRRPHTQSNIGRAVYDGRFSKHFIMQEGTFWRSILWKNAGGLDATFRVAGDFDLWRRFARLTDLVVVDSTFGYFRLRAGQLSADVAGYQAEIDRHLPAALKHGRRWAAWRDKLGFCRYRRVRRRYGRGWALKTYRALRLFGSIDVPLIVTSEPGLAARSGRA